MKGNGWKTALPVFLLSATLSTAVLAAGGLGVGVLGRAVPGIVPAPDVSPFAVVDGVTVTLPAQADTAVEDALLAMNRIPQPAPRADDTPPRPRAVTIAGETVPVEVPEPAPRVDTPRRPRAEAPERRSTGDDRDDDDVRADASPTEAPQDDNGKAGNDDGKAEGGSDKGNGGAGQSDDNADDNANPNANGTPRDARDDGSENQDHSGGGRDDDDQDDGERRVHAASADGNGRSGGGSHSGSAEGARNGRAAR